MSSSAHPAGQPFEQLDAARRRARHRLRPDATIAVAVASVAALGAALFLQETQLTTYACTTTSPSECSRVTTPFDGWAAWVIAAVVAGAALLVVRHWRGVRMASVPRLGVDGVGGAVLGALAALFAGYSLGPLGAQEPYIFPAAAAAVVAVAAWRRRDRLSAAGLATLTAVIVLAGRLAVTTPPWQWWLSRNQGLALCAAAVAISSAIVAVRWYRQDAR